MKFEQGQAAPKLSLKTIHGTDVRVPGCDGTLTHIQFRRFAGCPICNLHLQSFRQRHAEIEAARVKEVVIFHSSNEELLPYQGQFPFAVIGDPKKELYRRFGVESSIAAVARPTTWQALLSGLQLKERPTLGGIPNGGLLGLPADFLISSEGIITALHYGKHANDQWTVDEMLAAKIASESYSRPESLECEFFGSSVVAER